MNAPVIQVGYERVEIKLRLLTVMRTCSFFISSPHSASDLMNSRPKQITRLNSSPRLDHDIVERAAYLVMLLTLAAGVCCLSPSSCAWSPIIQVSSGAVCRGGNNADEFSFLIFPLTLDIYAFFHVLPLCRLPYTDRCRTIAR
jgi:hypothetical protein